MVYGSLLDILWQWENIGIFDFVLPFLLIFAIVYGVLSSTKFFGPNRGVYVIIAVVVGLLSLRYTGFFSSFLSELFPRLGIGLAVILAILVLVGMFIVEDQVKYWGYGLAAIGAVIAIVVVYQSFNARGYGFINTTNSDFVGFILLGVLLVGVIIAVAVSGSDRTHDPSRGKGVLLPWANLGGGHGGR